MMDGPASRPLLAVACMVGMMCAGLPLTVAHAQGTAASSAGQDDGAGPEAEDMATTTGAPADGAPLLRQGNTWGLFFSGGIPQVINRSADVAIVQAGVRWSHLWGRAGGGFLRGHPAFAVELLPLMTFDQQPRSFAAGFNLLYEHHFATGGRAIPVWRIGAGALYASEPTPPRETRHNFSLLTGLGLHIPVQDRTALSLEYRFHHVSNADSGFRNPGINAHTIVVGVTFR